MSFPTCGEISIVLNNKIEKILEYAFSAESQVVESARGTVWGAYIVLSQDTSIKNRKTNEGKFDSTLGTFAIFYIVLARLLFVRPGNPGKQKVNRSSRCWRLTIGKEVGQRSFSE
ncbi:hypothetical protein [Chryseolinea soli]|uniref:Uncharacterized protein n=1 Tax=Chryseolinea soli TaxID=2321403 RepID=A0A385SVR7_9BACT|nr:hypothetical protein [Chryseolinea soli]AYB34922.1 hypothetical protein D4L85_32000 [Chryseolinea soli]